MKRFLIVNHTQGAAKQELSAHRAGVETPEHTTQLPPGLPCGHTHEPTSGLNLTPNERNGKRAFWLLSCEEF